MTWIEPWGGRAPLFDAEGLPFCDRIAEVYVRGELHAVRTVFAVRRTRGDEPRPVLYCTGPDGRPVQLAPGEVRTDGIGKER